MTPTRRVTGLYTSDLEKHVFAMLLEKIPTLSFDVCGDASGKITIHVWGDSVDREIVVSPFDYVNDEDRWARENPTEASIIIGLRQMLEI